MLTCARVGFVRDLSQKKKHEVGRHSRFCSLHFDNADQKEMRVLNRIVRVTSRDLLYEPDPRHIELLIKAMDLEQANLQATACVQMGAQEEEDDIAPKHHEQGHPPDVQLVDSVIGNALHPFHKRQPNKKKTQVHVNQHIDIHKNTPYSETYGLPLRDVLLCGPLFSRACVNFEHRLDRWTGRPKHAIDALRKKFAVICKKPHFTLAFIVHRSTRSAHELSTSSRTWGLSGRKSRQPFRGQCKGCTPTVNSNAIPNAYPGATAHGTMNPNRHRPPPSWQPHPWG